MSADNHARTQTQLDLRPGDCVAGMRSLADASVDLVVTSPPYNLGIAYSKHRDNQPRGEYLAWSETWAREVFRVLKPGGSFFLNIGAAPSNPMLPHELAIAFSKIFALQNTIHWIKSITIRTRAGDEISAGHFKPINSQRFLTDCHEFVFHFTKNKDVKLDRLAVGVAYSDKSNIARWGHTGGRDRRCRGNTWFIPYETIRDRASQRPHPATFPVELAARCIRLHGQREGLVMLDPFLGIGHAALAARECDIARFIGFEIDEEYLNETRLRLELAPSSTRRVTPKSGEHGDGADDLPLFSAAPGNAAARSTNRRPKTLR